MPFRRAALAALFGLGCMTVSHAARAFDGFYVGPTDEFHVAKSDQPLHNDASIVVLMREGTRTVLSMSNTYKGPPEDFAMVVPVPVALEKDDVETLPREPFDKLETLSAPRLVEYWEQDPCAVESEGSGLGTIGGSGLGTIGGFGVGSGTGYGGDGDGDKVKVEAQFAVGEYDVAVLSAEESYFLEQWLVDHHFHVTKGVQAALARYVTWKQKFFVAKVDSKKLVRDANGVATLSPLRVSYESESFDLPLGLGLLNSAGAQDLIVFILAPKRYEAANYENVFVPTNLDVADEVRDRFPAFYGKLFDATLGKHDGRAVVTEYAWPAGACDPCPAPHAALTQDDVATLGGDLLYPHGVSLSMPSNPVIETRVRVSFPQRFGACYHPNLAKKPGLAGTDSVKFVIEPDGSVGAVTLEKGTFGDEAMRQCVRRVFERLGFPRPEKGKVSVTYPIDFQTDHAAPLPLPPSLTLTRLHTRYSPQTLGDDRLAFMAARPVVGGRELVVEGELESGAHSSWGNAFQARYAIRHPWTGPITCEKPVRGRWGALRPPVDDAGPPSGPNGAPGTIVAKDLAHAPRAHVQLAKLVLEGLSHPAAWDQAAESFPVKPPAAPRPKFVARRRRACHCDLALPGDDGRDALPFVAGLALLAARRRRREHAR